MLIRSHRRSTALLVLTLAACAGPQTSDEAFAPPPGDGKQDATEFAQCAPGLFEVPAPGTATITRNAGEDAYGLRMQMVAPVRDAGFFQIEVADAPDGEFSGAGPWASVGNVATGEVDKMATDIYVRAAAYHRSGCVGVSSVARLAKPDYAEVDDWGDGWIKVVSHTHTVPDVKEDAGAPVHANRINWFNGCFDHEDRAACHELLLRSFSEEGVQWMMDAAKDNDIDSVIITDHDNVGIWFTEIFKKYNRGDRNGPSVVPGLEWTSGLGHMTVVGNFLPTIDDDADVYSERDAAQIHRAVPLPPDMCDDTDEHHDINAPDFDGPDAPCVRDDHRGYGDDPISVADARASIDALHEAGALVFINHPTHELPDVPLIDTPVPMKWRLDNLDLVDGVEVGVPSPTIGNEDTPEYWREQGLMRGRRWVPIAGTDCHVENREYDGETACHKIATVTAIDFGAPYMWLKPLASTSRGALNDPDLVVAALREGRVTVVQDKDPAVVVDLGIDANDDGRLDYWSGTTVPACEQPDRDSFTVQVRVRPEQDHDYNVSVWRVGDEKKILQDEGLDKGETWVGEIEFSRKDHIPAGEDRGYLMVQVRENKTARPDDDAGFSTPIWFEAPRAGTADCHTRDADGA